MPPNSPMKGILSTSSRGTSPAGSICDSMAESAEYPKEFLMFKGSASWANWSAELYLQEWFGKPFHPLRGSSW